MELENSLWFYPVSCENLPMPVLGQEPGRNEDSGMEHSDQGPLCGERRPSAGGPKSGTGRNSSNTYLVHGSWLYLPGHTNSFLLRGLTTSSNCFKSADNYMIMVNSMMNKKHTRQIGEKMCTFG